MKSHSLLFGVGINDADYIVERRNHKTLKNFTCPFYLKWKNMLNRCYGKAYLSNNKTYNECEVCKEWLTFSNFKAWMEKQDWEGKHLDKDLLGDGTLYSPDSCAFLLPSVNSFLVREGGLTWCKRTNKYMVKCRNPLTGKREFLGYHDDPILAKRIWIYRKQQLSQELSKLEKDNRVASALMKYWVDSEQ